MLSEGASNEFRSSTRKEAGRRSRTLLCVPVYRHVRAMAMVMMVMVMLSLSLFVAGESSMWKRERKSSAVSIPAGYGPPIATAAGRRSAQPKLSGLRIQPHASTHASASLRGGDTAKVWIARSRARGRAVAASSSLVINCRGYINIEDMWPGAQGCHAMLSQTTWLVPLRVQPTYNDIHPSTGESSCRAVVLPTTRRSYSVSA